MKQESRWLLWIRGCMALGDAMFLSPEEMAACAFILQKRSLQLAKIPVKLECDPPRIVIGGDSCPGS